jgi:pimeloyl-ACP methyl ester carboxylesterase
MNYQPRAENLGKGEGFGITFQGRLTGGERLREIEWSAGMIEYEDTEGLGPVVVLLHGLVMNGSLWRLPFAYGWMTKRPIPHAVTDAWLHPLLTRREIRRDLTRYIRISMKGEMLAAAEGLRSFDRPALVVWAKEDRVMPPSHGRRLAELLPQGRLIEIADSYTLIPEDQPGELARAIRQFIRDEL